MSSKPVLACVAEVEAQKPEPPIDLSPEETEVWRTIVNKVPAHWFPVHLQPLLRNLCTHVVMTRRLGEQLIAVTDEPPTSTKQLKVIHGIQSMYMSHSKQLVVLSQRLRLTNLWDQKAERAIRKQLRSERKPWEIPDAIENEDIEATQ